MEWLALIPVIPVLVLLPAGWQRFLRWRGAHGDEVRQHLLNFDRLLNERTAGGGLTMSTFTNDDEKARAVAFKDLISRLHDAKLRAACTTIEEKYRSLFASSGGAWAGTSGALERRSSDPAYIRQQERHVEVADEMTDAVAKARARVNKLERFIVRT